MRLDLGGDGRARPSLGLGDGGAVHHDDARAVLDHVVGAAPKALAVCTGRPVVLDMSGSVVDHTPELREGGRHLYEAAVRVSEGQAVLACVSAGTHDFAYNA